MSGGDRLGALAALCRANAAPSGGCSFIASLQQKCGDEEGQSTSVEQEELQELRQEERDVLSSMFDEAFTVRELGGAEDWSVELQLEVPRRLVQAIQGEAAAGKGGSVPEVVRLQMHLPRGSAYPLAPPVVVLHEAPPTDNNRSLDARSGRSVFCLRRVRRAVAGALARLVRGEEVRGSAVLFACCLWVQQLEEEDGLGALLGQLATPPEPLCPPPPPQRQSKAGSTAAVPVSFTQQSAPSSAKARRPATPKKPPARTPLSRKEVSALNDAMLQAWKSRTAVGADRTQAQITRDSLPAAEHKEALLEAVEHHQVVLVAGETGCGKTTQVPQFLLDHFAARGRGGDVNLICTQPRRLAAMGVAERVAAEQGSALGETVGYQVRMDARRCRRTRLLFCTTGILLRQLHGDPDLKEVTHLLVDEVHERDVDTDFLLALLRPLLARRPSMKLILMSATMDAAQFVRYFQTAGSPPPPVLTIPGFVHPVQEHYLEDLDSQLYASSKDQDLAQLEEPEEEEGDSDDDPMTDPAGQEGQEQQHKHATPPSSRRVNLEQKYGGHRLFPLIAKTVLHAHQMGHDAGDDGAVLVFMSGIGEISRALAAIEQLAERLGCRRDLWLLPLHGSLSPAEQQKVFQRPQRGVRKVVVCTNVAETSITIDDCVFVIDSGKMKLMQYEAEGRLSSLEEQDVSAANARQRRGRAGRVRPGHCFRLFTRQKHASLSPHQSPEIHRVPLERLCLMVRFLGLGRPKVFLQEVLDPPAPTGVTAALQHLRSLGALDEKNGLTPLGSHLASMPVDAQVGKLLVYGALLRCPEQVLTIAAGLSGRSPFLRDAAADASKLRLSGRHLSDHLALLGAVQAWRQRLREGGAAIRSLCAEMGLHAEGLKQLWETRTQLKEALQDAGFLWREDDADGGEEAVKAVLCAGLYPHLARVHLPDKQYEELAGGAFERNVPAKDIRFFAPDSGESDRAESQEGDVRGGERRPATSRVFLHPSSALFAQGSRAYAVPWLVFSRKVRTSKVFLRDVSMVSAYALLLFGGRGNLDIQHDRGKLVLDGWVHFNAPARVGLLVRELRRETEALLRDKIARPSLDLTRSPVVDAILLLLRSNGL
mmetsp:Transcript_34742/g.64848  ORF Transcript_34742/g.64848 Transcript_34742/m.64848 type:complete len:1105 (-) Transcript_34742:639-3953(-)